MAHVEVTHRGELILLWRRGRAQIGILIFGCTAGTKFWGKAFALRCILGEMMNYGPLNWEDKVFAPMLGGKGSEEKVNCRLCFNFSNVCGFFL